jgi:hypothetical protein
VKEHGIASLQREMLPRERSFHLGYADLMIHRQHLDAFRAATSTSTPPAKSSPAPYQACIAAF